MINHKSNIFMSMKKSTLITTKSNFLVLVVIALLTTTNTFGATVTWAGTAGDGLWSSPTNWSSGLVPTAADNVVIPATFTVTLSGNAGKINKISVSGKLIISATGVLNVEQTVSSDPLVDIAGGEIQNDGSLTIKQTIASNNNLALKFSDGAAIANTKLTNTGVLTVDLTARAAGSTTACISFAHVTTNTKTAQLNLGGTININVPAQARVFELTSGKAIFDGNYTFGSTSDYKNWRFMQFIAGNLTIASTANIEIYSGYNLDNAGTIASSNSKEVVITNNGSLTLHGSSDVLGYGIYMNPQFAGFNCTLSNYGNITIDGKFPKGPIYMSGAAVTVTNTLNNYSGASLSLTNTGSTTGALAANTTATLTNIINNAGTMSFNSAASRNVYFGGSNSTFNNTGTVNLTKAFTGNSTTLACVVNNNAGGVFNFNVLDNAQVAVSNTNKITFNNNNGGKISGRGLFGAGTFFPQDGCILSPGGDNGIGMFTFLDVTMNLKGKCIMNVNGTAIAGTDYDQIYTNQAGSVLNIANTSLELTTGYTAANSDNVALFSSLGTVTGTLASITAPASWTATYTTSTAGLRYLAPSILVASNTNISSLGDVSSSDITVATGNDLTINATTAAKSITAAPGAKITMSSNYSLSASNGITLQSDETGTATLVDNNTTDPQTVNATVKQYVTEGRNWYMSIPLASISASVLNKGTSVVMYDEPTGQWVAPDLNMLDKMRGYIQTATATPLTGTTGTVEFSGALNTGAQSITLSRTAGKTGFNLVGNPYPSYLDWDMVTKTNVSNTMWYRTKEGSVYKFYTYIANEGVGIGVPASVTNKIPPMQAFWVRVVNEGTGSIAVNNNMRSHKDASGNILKAPKQQNQLLVRLQVSNGVNNDEAVIYFNANASDSFDRYDAQKRSNDNPAIPEIFTQAGNEKLVINGMNKIPFNTEIPVGFTSGTAGEFTLSVVELSSFETGTRIVLKDKQKPESEFDLTGGISYQFSSPAVAFSTDRFSLIFRTSGSTTNVEKPALQNIQVYLSADQQITINAPEKSIYSVYNGSGQIIENGIIHTQNQLTNIKPAAGVYVVKVNNVTNRLIVK